MSSQFLIQCQLSNYTREGIFVLEADSGWQMMTGRVLEFLKLSPKMTIDIIGPCRFQLRTQPEKLNPTIFSGSRVRYIEIPIIPNALATRYDFDFDGIAHALALDAHRSSQVLRYTHVYINDPMLLRNYKALFNLKAGYQPKFIVHSHFVDNPEAPKFPTDASLWWGQCEAAIRADYNFWQCESAMNTFFSSMAKTYKQEVVDEVRAKSMPYDDGYSIAEITSLVSYAGLRFDINEFYEKTKNKIVIFVPNRVGGKGVSSDYTQCGKFLFELLPELRKVRQDFVVVAGNPSQKFTNKQLEEMCGEYGYINLVEDGFTRDEYKFVASKSDIVVGLYNDDAFGGTSSRECIELGCLPLWLNVNEYATIAAEAGGYPYLVHPNFDNFVEIADALLNDCKNQMLLEALRRVVRERCSYEMTTPNAFVAMGVE